MHGRVKVKTTAQQQEEKRRDRARKLKEFQNASALAFRKISAKEYDEVGLKVTAEILSRNSDISSLWNYRKRVFLSRKNQPDDLRQTFFEKELELLVSCLRTNPKSYGSWHHRCFVLLNMPRPNWIGELDLCNQFFKLDDRNFHCWDYRRFVCNSSDTDIKLDDELRMTNRLIESNFSNYSSWHYRSKILTKLNPCSKFFGHVEENKLLQELSYVQNAFFTDPNDQSAWFYNQWLIGQCDLPQKLLFAHVGFSKFTCIFRKPLSRRHLTNNFSAFINGNKLLGGWQTLVSHRYQKYDFAWEFHLENFSIQENVILTLKCFDEVIMIDTGSEKNSSFYSPLNEFNQIHSSTKSSVLQAELDSCIELNDLEPGNKWIVLTLVKLMVVLDRAKYRGDIEKYLLEMQNIDPDRYNYYSDLRSRIVIESAISSHLFNLDCVSFRGMGVTRIYHLQYFFCIRTLDLSNNKLTALTGPFYLMLSCEELLADYNEISDISGLENMPKLGILSLKGNNLSHVGQLNSLVTCPALKKIDISENSLQFVQPCFLANVDVIV